MLKKRSELHQDNVFPFKWPTAASFQMWANLDPRRWIPNTTGLNTGQAPLPNTLLLRNNKAFLESVSRLLKFAILK